MANLEAIPEKQPHRDREQLLRRIIEQMRAAPALSDILELAVAELQGFLQVDRVKIYTFHPDQSGQVAAEARAGDRLPSLRGLCFPAEDIPPAARQAFIAARQRVIVDCDAGQRITDAPVNSAGADDLRYAPVDACHSAYLQAMGVCSSLVVPILVQDDLWGLLVAHHSQPHAYDELELQTVQLVADQVAIAVAQAQLLRRAQQQAEREEALNRISNLLHAPQADAEQWQAAIAALTAATGSDGGRLYLHGDGTESSYRLYQSGVQPAILILEATPFWQQFLAEPADAWLTVTHCPRLACDLPNLQSSAEFDLHTIADVAAQPELRDLAALFQPARIHSLAIVPLQYQQRCIGCLTLFRCEVDTETVWAGRRDRDRRNDRPRLSFAAWREQHRQAPSLWTAEEVKLIKTLALHLYVAVLERRLRRVLEHHAYHDRLTGLPNRLLFGDLLAVSLAETQLQRDRLLAVLFLDLDGFKTINDTLGHPTGDILLQQVAERLQSCLREGDVVARWGGDEFAILLPALPNAQKAHVIALKILAALNVPFHQAGRDLYIKGSVGIAIAPYHGEEADVLLAHADAAMYQAKQEGRNTFRVYTPALGTQMQERLLLEHSLYKALEANEFSLHYQPLLSLSAQTIIGVEALIRWYAPGQDWISPAQFIPLAEETGLIVPLGEWVLQTACQQLMQWRQEAGLPLRLAVNLSARQFRERSLLPTIARILSETGVDPQWLDLEITESTAMQDLALTVEVLHQLRELGLQIAIDDFGTGYSSLASLKHFPIDKLKIDRSFISDLAGDRHDAAIVRAIIALGRGLNLTVVAEGVETAAQLELLRDMGCDVVQGFGISRPLSALAIADFLLGNTAHLHSAVD